MTFRELKYPKEISRKKKLSLYKCYILEPLKKGAPVRTINLNMDRERFALTEELAVQYALNQMGVNEALKFLFGFSGLENAGKVDEDEDSENENEIETGEESEIEEESNVNRDSFFVILEIVLRNGVMEEEILLPATPGDMIVEDPRYDPIDGLLTATIRDRYDTMHIKNYTIHDIAVEIVSDRLLIKTLKLDEVVINSALTGGK